MRLGGLKAVAAAAALVGALAPAAHASHPGCPEWSDGASAYPYPFGQAAHSLPQCRLGARGGADVGTHALLPFRINMRREIGNLEPNPLTGEVRWPLVDSLGRPLAILTRHADRWETTDPLTGAVIYTDRTLSPDQLTVQGRGCMVHDALEERFALIAFHAHDRGTIPAGASIVPYQLRAFIPRAALPATDAAGRSVRSVVDDYDTGCGATSDDLRAPERVPDAAFDSEAHQFYGQDGRARTYATYNVKAPYRGARYVVINTPGVGGGGIVRAVIGADDPVAVDDELSYCDPNVAPAGRAPAASWAHGRVAATRIAGWLPRRCS